jgi:hypothetical protein
MEHYTKHLFFGCNKNFFSVYLFLLAASISFLFNSEYSFKMQNHVNAGSIKIKWIFSVILWLMKQVVGESFPECAFEWLYVLDEFCLGREHKKSQFNLV